MKRYIIYGPIWHHRSAGLRALYNLQKSLIMKGYDCIYYCFGSDPVAINEVTDDDVVIYPEIVKGNPLKANNVVRWLLNEPGVCGGDGIYSETDMVFFHMFRERYSNVTGLPLRINPYDTNLLRDLGLPREHNLIWVYKGAGKKRIPLDGIEITINWPESKRELIDLLQRCKIFYTYDDASALNFEAKLCGCDVRLINADGSIVPYPFTGSLEKTFAESENQLDDFIRITQFETNYNDIFQERILTEGEQLFGTGDVERAGELFKQVLTVAPNSIEALNNLGVIAFQQGEMDRAVSYFTRVLKINAGCSKTLANLGKCAEFQEDYAKAAECFEKSLSLEPDEINTLNSLGNCYTHMKNFKKAKDAYEKSLTLDCVQENIKGILEGLTGN